MMATDSLRFIVPLGVSFRWPLPCRCAGRARAFAPLFAQHPEPPSHAQASCLERARPVAVAAFAGRLAAGSTAPPDRRRPERKRGAKAEGKIKVRGTQPLENPVCTWGGAARAWERHGAVRVRNAASALENARASSARLLWSWMEVPHEQS